MKTACRARRALGGALVAAAVVAAVLACLASASANPSYPVVNVTVSMPSSAPFPHKWKECWGSGHAALTLRADWRAHLQRAQLELGLRGVRYHGLFDDDMGVVQATGTYNFTAIDSTWDYFVQLGVKPVVELSFMPCVLANCRCV